MRVQVNSDKTIEVNDGLKLAVRAHLVKSFARYGGRITRVELHLSDPNGTRGGSNDKRCLMEVRPSGMDPVAVDSNGSTIDEAYKGATRKMVRKLTARFARLARKVPVAANDAALPELPSPAAPRAQKATKRAPRSKRAK
jgi:hypothetical protein